MSARGAGVPEKEGTMDYAVSRGGASSCEMLECARILKDIDGERRMLASFASDPGTFSQEGFGCEMERHRERIFDLTELEELMMLRTRYVDFEPHWRAHSRFRSFLRRASGREDLLFCSAWLRQHEGTDDADFRHWLRHAAAPAPGPDRPDCLYRVHPDRVLLTAKLQMARITV